MSTSDLPEDKAWEEWLTHPCTKALRQWAERKRKGLMEQWAAGNFSDGFDVAMAVKNAGATGACSAYNEVKEMDLTQITTELSDATE